MDSFNLSDIDPIEFVVGYLQFFYTNFTRNAIHMWDGMSAFKYIRIIAIVGGYLLLRPYIVKVGNYIQEREHAKASKASKAAEEKERQREKKRGMKVLGANALRGGVDEPKVEKKKGGKGVRFSEDVEVDSEPEGNATGGDVKWGKKARQRQRKVEKLVAEAEENRLKEDDIMDLLVDYEEGKDGW